MENLVDSRQISKLVELNSDLEEKCLVKIWLNSSVESADEGSFCASVWDSVYCWPPTQAGEVIQKKCSEIFNESFSQYAAQLVGFASRECLLNGTWAQGNDSNYDECEASFQFYLNQIEEDNLLVPVVHHMLFFGSILSLLCLGISLAVFYNYQCLRCDRVTVHIQLMLSLVLRFLLMFMIAEPFVIGHKGSYRDVEILCKSTLVLFLYSTFSSIGWMFVEGLFLNVVLTTGLATICTQRELTAYKTIGWGVPAIFVGIFVVFLAFTNEETCWKGYSEMDAMWILLGPIGFALVINGLFLLNILRILLNKINNSRTHVDTSRAKAAAKAIAILFPVLGINNLILLYNPGGAFNKYFVLLNTFFSSTQGILVSIVFCFADKEVGAAIKRSLDRVNARRIGNSNIRAQNGVPPQLTPMMEMFSRRESNQCDDNVLEQTV